MWLSPSGLVTRPIPDLSSNLAVTSRVMSDPCLKIETLTRHIAIRYEAIMVQKCFIDSWFSSELRIIYKIIIRSWKYLIFEMAYFPHQAICHKYFNEPRVIRCQMCCCCHEPGWRNLRDHCWAQHRHQAHTTGQANYFMEEFYLENGHLEGKTLTSNHFVWCLLLDNILMS